MIRSGWLVGQIPIDAANPTGLIDPFGLSPCKTGASGSLGAVAPVEKISQYIFKEGATHGKDTVFRNLGYDASHSESLAHLWSKRAADKYAKGDYTLGKLDEFGQRINISIDLPGIGEAAERISHLKSGWMILPDGSIKLNTPFSGFTK